MCGQAWQVGLHKVGGDDEQHENVLGSSLRRIVTVASRRELQTVHESPGTVPS